MTIKPRFQAYISDDLIVPTFLLHYQNQWCDVHYSDSANTLTIGSDVYSLADGNVFLFEPTTPLTIDRMSIATSQEHTVVDGRPILDAIEAQLEEREVSVGQDVRDSARTHANRARTGLDR